MLAAAILQTPACSNGDTVLALTINSNQADVGGPANLRVTVTPTSGAPVTETFAPDLIDGAIITTFFRRFTLNGLTGEVTVTVDALDVLGHRLPQRDDHRRSGRAWRGGGAGRAKRPSPPEPDAGTPPDGGGAGSGPGGSGSGGRGGGGSAARVAAAPAAVTRQRNLITNGDFAAGMANWRVEAGTGNINTGRFCLMGPGSGTLLAWDAELEPVTLAGATDLSHLLLGVGDGGKPPDARQGRPLRLRPTRPTTRSTIR